MKSIVKVLAPAALVFAAFSAHAGEGPIEVGPVMSGTTATASAAASNANALYIGQNEGGLIVNPSFEAVSQARPMMGFVQPRVIGA